MSEEQPVLEVLEDLVPEELQARAWAVCMGKGWYFGHGSHEEDAARFWKLDLDDDPVFDAIWQQARSRCETIAGAPLRVIRQYANGHTYGLGGKPHLDDNRPGSFTLLYYPMAEWQAGWDGETVFLDPDGEIALAVRPRPNRGVFFDSRIAHAGRAPGRSCTALRVTVAFKLESVPVEIPAAPESGGIAVAEIERNGATRAYCARVRSEFVKELTTRHLESRGKTIRLPGFRPGKIPLAILDQRYGAAARAEVTNQLAAQAADRIFATGGLASGIEITSGAAAGDVEFRITVTHLPDLPDIDFSQLVLERLTASSADLAAAGLASETAREMLEDHLRQQVLDYLDSAYGFTVAPRLIEREFRAISGAAESQMDAAVADPSSRESIAAELRVIAERRVRLGAVVRELARRNNIEATDTGSNNASMESKVVRWLVAQAAVSERSATNDELRELAT